MFLAKFINKFLSLFSKSSEDNYNVDYPLGTMFVCKDCDKYCIGRISQEQSLFPIFDLEDKVWGVYWPDGTWSEPCYCLDCFIQFQNLKVD